MSWRRSTVGLIVFAATLVGYALAQVVATDSYSTNAAGLTSPWNRLVSVTPSDTDQLANVSRGLYVTTGGALKITTAGGSTVTFTAADNTMYPFRVKQVWSTGTSATGILAGD